MSSRMIGRRALFAAAAGQYLMRDVAQRSNSLATAGRKSAPRLLRSARLCLVGVATALSLLAVPATASAVTYGLADARGAFLNYGTIGFNCFNALKSSLPVAVRLLNFTRVQAHGGFNVSDPRRTSERHARLAVAR
jgi:hypothetical protein